MVSSTMQYSRGPRPKKAQAPSNPVSSFFQKVSLAWRIFFPDAPKEVSPKEEVKKRLKVGLHALSTS
jgi:hypothetical protein